MKKKKKEKKSECKSREKQVSFSKAHVMNKLHDDPVRCFTVCTGTQSRAGKKCLWNPSLSKEELNREKPPQISGPPLKTLVQLLSLMPLCKNIHLLLLLLRNDQLNNTDTDRTGKNVFTLRNFGVCFKAVALDHDTQMETIFMHKIK